MPKIYTLNALGDDFNMEHTLNILEHTLNTLWTHSEHSNTLWTYFEDMPKIWQNLKNINQWPTLQGSNSY